MTEQKCYICNGTAQIYSGHLSKQALSTDSVECPRCGRYKISQYIIGTGGVRQYVDNDQIHILSAITRQASDSDRVITITNENISELIQSVPIPKNPLEQMNRIILYIGNHQSKADGIVEFELNRDYPLAFANDHTELHYILYALVERGLLEEPQASTQKWRFRLSPEGWEKLEQLKKVQIDSDQAFVAMWFDKKLTDAYEEGFKPALKSANFRPFKVDLKEHNGKIDDEIIAEIRRSGLMVADFTGHRGGVYFEMGFAMGLGLYVIRTCKETDIDELHFDVRQYNFIVWETPQDLRNKLENRIAATIPGRALVH